MMLCIHSFYDPRLLVTMNVQRYLQQRSSSRVLLFATSNHNNNIAHGKKYQWNNRPQATTMMMKLFSTKTSNNMKAVVDTGSTGKSKSNMLKSTPTSNSNSNNNNTDKQQQLLVKKTGAFVSKLPEVYPSPIHFKRAIRRTREIKIDSNIKNLRNANRKLSAQVLDALMKQLTVPITETMNTYKYSLKELHPFETTVMELTVVARSKAGLPHLDDVLKDLQVLRANTSRIGKDFAGRAKNASSAMEARDLMAEGIRTLENYYLTTPEATALEQLADIQKDLRRIPMVELNVPTVVLVGAPNVGKSSIVRAVSSGTPEVNDYPFTTRGVTIGHIVDAERGIRFQVMDTPGLLDRPIEERNEMEKLTFASMAHLPTAVMFVIDPSGLSGEKSTLAAQLNVRQYLKTRFPKRPWIDIVSKADLELTSEVESQLPEGYLSVSVHNGANMKALRELLEDMLLDLKHQLAIRNSTTSTTTTTTTTTGGDDAASAGNSSQAE